MKKLIIFTTAVLSCVVGFAQTVTLTFTGRDADNHFIAFDRVEIGNVTRSWQETIYYPDTIIVLGGTGIEENAFTKGFALAQNNPNPFEVTTNATLTTSESGEVTMEMLDMNGCIVASQKFAAIQAGAHQFVLTVAAPGTYILIARQNGKTSSIKMVNKGEEAINRVEYVGLSGTKAEIPEQKNGSKGIISSPFNVGDEMVYIGYVNINGVEYTSQTIRKNQIVSEVFLLNFNTTTPAGLATVTTDTITDIHSTTATCGGNVVNDGGYGVIERGICWSTTPNPVFNDNHISNGDGLGAYTCQLTNLSESTTYYVRAYATNSVGIAYGEQQSFTTPSTPSFTCGVSTVSDYDGNLYNTVVIGTQCWMKENLRTTHYANGNSILNGNTSSLTIPYYFDYNSSDMILPLRGYLYNRVAVMNGANSSNANPSGVQGICPTGWHVPSDAEWTQLINYMGSQSQYVCGGDSTYIAKALASVTGWNNSNNTCAVGNNPSANNASGFSAVPAGYWIGSSFTHVGKYTRFWSTTSAGGSGNAGFCRRIAYDGANLGIGSDEYSGFSVRCLCD